MLSTTDGDIEARLLGGFRVSHDGRSLAGFESRKVRALFAYLAAHRGRSFTREHLAALLWPEEGEEAARRNLRQALYNLRQTLDRAHPAEAILQSSHQEALLTRSPRLWLDVEVFAAAAATAIDGGVLDPEALGSAVRLYEGDFLEGFHAGESPEFEEWLLAEQARLRERAIATLLALTEHHLAAGTYSLGIEYATRLVRIDPLSEAAHRKLMLLNAFAGRRSRAIAQYHELARLLDGELGVDPGEETTYYYRSILAETLPDPGVREKAEPVGPVIPLVGRRDALARLRRTWDEVRAGRGRMTRVLGPSGVGKTRLVRTFLHEVTAAGPVPVLQARFPELAPPVAFRAIAEALGDGLTHEVQLADAVKEALDDAALADLVLLVPALRHLLPRPGDAASGSGRPERLFEAVAQALASPGRPLILFLDDLQEADPASLELLTFLRERLAWEPVWLVWAASRDLPVDGGETVELEGLDEGAVARIAASLVPDRPAELVPLLAHAAGLPLAVAELVNLLWDEGLLVELPEHRWRLHDLPAAPRQWGGLEEIVRRRIEDLPTSTRRLLALAAVAGPEFDADLLCQAEREHPTVVETGLYLFLERWLGRLRLGYWADSREQRDLTLWTAGARRGTFEFSHPALRETVYRSLAEERRGVLHRRVAQALEERSAAGLPWRAETLAHHHLLGGAPERALPYLERAAANALRLHAAATAEHYLGRAAEVLEALERERPAEAVAWREARARLSALDEGLVDPGDEGGHPSAGSGARS
ncbi:MAG TPA: AAA family ATPase [Thermoanaerobaculia bacterium]